MQVLNMTIFFQRKTNKSTFQALSRLLMRSEKLVKIIYNAKEIYKRVATFTEVLTTYFYSFFSTMTDDTCTFSYISAKDFAPKTATGVQRSWFDLKLEFGRQGEGLPGAKYYKTISE